MKRIKTDIPHNYITIKVTKSRIDKGLLAIPVSLIYLFPENADEVYLVNEDGTEERKSFTPYKSSSRECRIGGMKELYEKYSVQKGDELVIQPLGNNRYRIIPEKVFLGKVKEFERKAEETDNDREIESLIHDFTNFVNTEPEILIKKEFLRLSKTRIEARKVVPKKETGVRERVPPFIRRMLLNLYHGKCQVSGFTFLMKNGQPYFEIHHIKPELGNHPKNLLVVSPNVHAQFTYAYVKHFFDSGGWLRKVKFNDKTYEVYQIIDNLPSGYMKEVHFT